MNTIDGELYLATAGLLRVLQKRRFVADNDINKFTKSVYKKCRKFLTDPEFEKINLDLPKVNHLEVAELLEGAQDPAWLEQRIAGIEDIDVASSLGLLLGQASQYLLKELPILPQSVLSRKVKVSDFASSRFNRVFRTVDDPMSVLGDMLMGCLSRKQAETMRDVYPALYDLVVEQLNLAAIELTAKDKSFTIPYKKLKQISVLTLSNTVSHTLAEALQANFVSGEEASSEVSGGQMSGARIEDQSLTQTQRVELGS